MARSKKKLDFWHRRRGYAAVVLVSLLVAYGITSRAIDTGSLIEYFVAIVLIGLAINRSIRIARSF